jgi:uncharacterized repeat protein (TIGR03803 family)
MKKLILIMFFLLLAAVAWPQTEQTILTFTGTNGNGPMTGLIQDSKGNFYGATVNGGANGSGIVYKLTKSAKGKWKQTILYSFGPQPGTDGCDPQMPFLAMDKHGHLYGTTPCGGAHSNGTVFELTPSKLPWKETILYSFTGGDDGGSPIGGVIFDSKGNLYGTTNSGGASENCPAGCGVVFELIPDKKTWNFSVVHTFTGIPSDVPCGVYDGASPYRMTPAIDDAGNIFGTTINGGESCDNAGTVWELSPIEDGGWNYSILHAMNEVESDATPEAGGVLDSEDNFYFTNAYSNVYELVAAQGYSDQLLYYNPNGNIGGAYDTVSFDKSGNLYWTTQSAYVQDGDEGAVFELSPNGEGGWKQSTVYAFASGGAAGVSPWGGVTIDSAGNLYGTCTQYGASDSDKGTVWEITP